ncbi:MAG: hypothetical protein ABJD97_09185 [Betaproteobacteria bacterium]
MRSSSLPPSAKLSRIQQAVSALCAFAGLCASPQALAAADDMSAPASPIAAPAAPTGFVAATRKLIGDVMETERVAVAVLREHVVSPVMATSWRLSVSAPRLTRATALVTRAPANLDAYGDAAQAPYDLPDLSLGARWRVMHGDANSHVPMAAWMPDQQIADAHLAALRPVLNLSGEWSLPNDFSLGVMPGMAIDMTPQGRRLATGTFAVTLGKSWSPQWRTFVDMARDRMASVQMAGVSTTLDAGITFVATPTTQIDFAVTHGLSETAPPFQAGVGVSSTF